MLRDILTGLCVGVTVVIIALGISFLVAIIAMAAELLIY